MPTRKAKPSVVVALAIAMLLTTFCGCDTQTASVPVDDRWPAPSQARMPEGASPVKFRQRYCSIIRLQPDKIEEYEELHKDVPQAVVDAMHAAKIMNFSVFVKLVEDEYFARIDELVPVFKAMGMDLDSQQFTPVTWVLWALKPWRV